MFSPQWQAMQHQVQQLGRLLPWRKAALRRVARRPGDDAQDQEAPLEDRPLGCGWFDSSHDLQHGLQVQEADPQALSQLPLSAWLALQVTSCYEVDTSLDAGPGMITAPTVH